MHTSHINHFIFFILVVFISACTTPKKMNTPTEDAALQKFSSLLIGQFSSKRQAEMDSTYFDISLSMSRIWEDRTDAIWLYVEQAMTTKKDKPYRQRVYKLSHPSKSTFVSYIYMIKNQEQIIGLQYDAVKRKTLTPDMITLKDGCAVTLVENKGVYQGGTDTNKCPSELRGASYATTKIILKKGFLESWDQGFNNEGKQVWGAEKGGYQFIKE